MEDKARELLRILNDNGYAAYIVGGYTRDVLLGRKSNDIDICTSATPKEILDIFEDVKISDMQYGSVVITYKGYKFDVTTFRKEIKYESNRRPIKIKYIRDIKKDLLRRDFTINTLCINDKGEVLDVLGVRSDLDNIKLQNSSKSNTSKYSKRILFNLISRITHCSKYPIIQVTSYT